MPLSYDSFLYEWQSVVTKFDVNIGVMFQTRSMAQMSQMLRDKIRMKYEHDTFDRKVLDAQLFAKLENSPSTRRLAKAS